VPVPIQIFENQPAILSTAGNGAGQGHIYKIGASGAQLLTNASSPAKTGDTLVIYAVGLGPVTPALKSGDPAPFTTLEPITGTPGVTIAGVQAKVVFAGLTPGFSGLYQVNALVPAGITPGNRVPVTVSVNGRASAGDVFMSVQ
jgi:adhesin/invasin